MCCNHFLQTNEISVTEMRRQMFASILVVFGDQKWFGVEADVIYFWLKKKTQRYIEGPRTSNHICDFLELPSFPLCSYMVIESSCRCVLMK